MMSDRIANREKYESYIESQKNIYDMFVSYIEAEYRQKIEVLKKNESNIKPQQYPPFWWYEEEKLNEKMQQIIQVLQRILENNINPIYVKLDELIQLDELDELDEPDELDELDEPDEPDEPDELDELAELDEPAEPDEQYPQKHPRIQMLVKQHYMGPDENEYLYNLKNKQLKQQQQQQQEQL